jgi:hypothetical protein
VYEAAPAADEAMRAAVAAMLARIFFMVDCLPGGVMFMQGLKQNPCQNHKSLILLNSINGAREFP